MNGWMLNRRPNLWMMKKYSPMNTNAYIDFFSMKEMRGVGNCTSSGFSSTQKLAQNDFIATSSFHAFLFSNITISLWQFKPETCIHWSPKTWAFSVVKSTSLNPMRLTSLIGFIILYFRFSEVKGKSESASYMIIVLLQRSLTHVVRDLSPSYISLCLQPIPLLRSVRFCRTFSVKYYLTRN